MPAAAVIRMREFGLASRVQATAAAASQLHD